MKLKPSLTIERAGRSQGLTSAIACLNASKRLYCSEEASSGVSTFLSTREANSSLASSAGIESWNLRSKSLLATPTSSWDFLDPLTKGMSKSLSDGSDPNRFRFCRFAPAFLLGSKSLRMLSLFSEVGVEDFWRGRVFSYCGFFGRELNSLGSSLPFHPSQYAS